MVQRNAVALETKNLWFPNMGSLVPATYMTISKLCVCVFVCAHMHVIHTCSEPRWLVFSSVILHLIV